VKYLGVDWASEAHQCGLVDEEGTIVAEWSVPNDGEGLDALLGRLQEEGGPAGVLVAVESGAPLVVDQLLEAGFTVYVLNPKQADRFRDRLTAAGAKDDRRDALVLAGAIRTDRDRLHPAARDSALCEEIRLRDRARSRKVADRTRLSNQLRQVLSRYYPGILALGRDMHDPFFLDLLEAYPDPEKAAGARTPRLERLLRSHRIRSIHTPDLHGLLRRPRPHVPPYVTQACRAEAADLVARIRLLNTLLARAEKELDALGKEHPDCEILTTLPGLGRRLAVRVIAELGDRRDRYLDPTTLQALAGTAPVTRRSGKRVFSVRMRKGCNRTLQAALFIMARCSIHTSDWAGAYYRHRRDGGCPHATAVRALSNKWAKILWAVLTRHEAYDEDRHMATLRARAVSWAPAAEAAA